MGKELNWCIITALIEDCDKKIACEGISRPVYSAVTYGENGEKSPLSFTFSSLSQIRSNVGLKPGDIVKFTGRIFEFPSDNLMFYPGEVLSVDSCDDSEDYLARTLILKEMCLNSPNIVIVEGIKTDGNGGASIIKVKKSESVRGEVRKVSHLVVNHEKCDISEKTRVLFEGDLSPKGLVGRMWKR